MSRFFVKDNAISHDSIFITNRDDIKHIIKVLRMNVGTLLDISDSNEFEYKCEISEIEQDQIVCKIHDKQRFSREPKIKVTLYQGIPKQGKMETIIQKCVELGIYKIVPVFTARTIVVDKHGKMEHKVQRWQKVSDEAVKQCQRGIKPKINEPLEFKDLIIILKKQVEDGRLVFFPYENETKVTIKDVLRAWNANSDISQKISYVIGPEGGFSESEVVLLNMLGAKSVSLGRTILRTETAGLAALSMIMYELEI